MNRLRNIAYPECSAQSPCCVELRLKSLSLGRQTVQSHLEIAPLALLELVLGSKPPEFLSHAPLPDDEPGAAR